MLYVFMIFVFCQLLTGCVKAQSFETFYGEWRVEKNIVFQAIGGENEEEYGERIKREKICLKSIFIIDSNGIRTENRACEFLHCDTKYLQPDHKIVRIVKDTEYTLTAMGNEMIDSNVIGTRFVTLLDSAYEKRHLSFYDTNCQLDYGNSTLKVCIVSEDKIGLYQDYNLIILKRRHR